MSLCTKRYIYTARESNLSRGAGNGSFCNMCFTLCETAHNSMSCSACSALQHLQWLSSMRAKHDFIDSLCKMSSADSLSQGMKHHLLTDFHPFNLLTMSLCRLATLRQPEKMASFSKHLRDMKTTAQIIMRSFRCVAVLTGVDTNLQLIIMTKSHKHS